MLQNNWSPPPRKGSQSFVLKKFCRLAHAAGENRDSPRKSLLLLFFRKEDFPTLPPGTHIASPGAATIRATTE
jgi:hypothetical protein